MFGRVFSILQSCALVQCRRFFVGTSRGCMYDTVPEVNIQYSNTGTSFSLMK